MRDPTPPDRLGGLATSRRRVDRRPRCDAGSRRRCPGTHLPRLDRRHRRDSQIGQVARNCDHRRGDTAPPTTRRRQTRQLRRGEPGQPAAARGLRRPGVAASARRRVIDCVATDHAPHATTRNASSSPGPTRDAGLQTALSVVAETMVQPGLLNWRGVAKVMSENPARIAGCPIRAVRWRSVNRPT